MQSKLFCPLINRTCTEECALRMDEGCAIREALNSLTVLSEVNPVALSDAVDNIAAITFCKDDGSLFVGGNVFVQGGNIDICS